MSKGKAMDAGRRSAMMPDDLVRDYIAAWTEPDSATRLRLLSAAWSESGVYQDPRCDVAGRENLLQHIDAFQKRMPHSKFKLTSDVLHHHGKFCFSWELIDAAGDMVLSGSDFGEVDHDGRILRLTGFFHHRLD